MNVANTAMLVHAGPNPDFVTEDLRAVMRGEIGFASTHPRYGSVVLSPRGGAAIELSVPGAAEFPRIDPRRTGQRHRKTFALSGSGSEDGWPFRRVASIDPEQGAIDGWTYPRDQIPEEHVFVPRGEAEGDGWQVGVLSQGSVQHAFATFARSWRR